MELTEEQKEELKLLAEWKRIYDLPDHTETKDDIIMQAQLGILYGPNDFRHEYMFAEKVADLPSVVQFPLVLVMIKDGKHSEKVINPRYRERGIFAEFPMMKKGLLPMEYYNAYYKDTETVRYAIQQS